MDVKGLARMKGLGWGDSSGEGWQSASSAEKAGIKTDDSCPCYTWQAPLALNVVPNFNKQVLNRFLLQLKMRLTPTWRSSWLGTRT